MHLISVLEPCILVTMAGHVAGTCLCDHLVSFFFFFFFCKLDSFKKSFIYLVALGLSCSMQDLVS